jgi:phosphotransferase system enzyme I (PtsI)
MFPMIATMQELIDAKKVLEECKNELTSEGIKYDDVKIGIMIEIPSAAILADKFAKEVDFFSIGTNDLIQYTFAADRMNQLVSYLYQPYNPSLLRLIKMVIDASHKEGIWTGMCGEMAGDLVAAPILLGLGLDEFSMSATSILKVRKLFSKLSKQEMEVFANKCLEMSSNEEVHNYMLEILKREGKD